MFRICALLLIIIFESIFISCNHRNSKARINHYNAKNQTFNTKKEKKYVPTKIAKAYFLIENSASVFGYVTKYTNYVNSIFELANNENFVTQNTKLDIYFVNGFEGKYLNKIGEKPQILDSSLNVKSYKIGDISKSDINSIFELAMSRAVLDTISILISDGIYDIQNPDEVENELTGLSKATRTKFIKKLLKDNMETIVVKELSDFNGYYYFASKHKKLLIKHKRPFYIWIFGNSNLLNKYFPDDYFRTHYKDVTDIARFFKIEDNTNVPFKIISARNSFSSFRISRKEYNQIEDVNLSTNSRKLVIPIAVNLSQIELPKDYLINKNNYLISSNYTIDSIKPVKSPIYEAEEINPTNIIYISSMSNPFGNVWIRLKYQKPEWIDNTGMENEETVISDSTHTFGFNYLMESIDEAYQYINNNKYFLNILIKVSK